VINIAQYEDVNSSDQQMEQAPAPPPPPPPRRRRREATVNEARAARTVGPSVSVHRLNRHQQQYRQY